MLPARIRAVVFDYFGVIEFGNGELNEELLRSFPRLKARGLKIGIFSNADSFLRERLKEFGLLDTADALVISGEIGHKKPHQEAFQALFEKLALKPNEVVFIDDSPENLAKAGEIGYIPILFKDNVQLRTDLAALGTSLG